MKVYKRKWELHGNHRNSILRKWRQGYRLPQIAKELKTTKHEVEAVLISSGVNPLALEARRLKVD